MFARGRYSNETIILVPKTIQGVMALTAGTENNIWVEAGLAAFSTRVYMSLVTRASRLALDPGVSMLALHSAEKAVAFGNGLLQTALRILIWLILERLAHLPAT